MLTILVGKSASGRNTIASQMVNTGWTYIFSAASEDAKYPNIYTNEEYVVILDIQKAKEYINHYGKKNCFVISIEASDSIRKERASNQISFDEIEWDRKLIEETNEYNSKNIDAIANFRVKNFDNLDNIILQIKQAHYMYKIIAG